MSGVALGALLLAPALLIAPGPALGRLRPAGRRARRRPVVPLAAVGGVAGVLVLPPTALLAAGLVAVLLTAKSRRRARRRRRCSEGRALAAALETLVGELRAGAHPVTAFDAAGAEASPAVAAPVRAVAARARLGADVAGGLEAMAAGSAVPSYWTRLALCWRLGAEHGLAMSALMQTAQRDIVERQRFGDRVDAGAAGARTTAAILAGLPLLGVVFGQLIGARPVQFLFGPGVGGVVLVAGAALICLGSAWSDRIIDRLLS